MIRKEHTVEVFSDWFKNKASADYISENDVVAVVDAEWVRDHYEQFDHHGTGHVTRFMRLRDWSIIEIKMNGSVVKDDSIPNGFPMNELVILLDSHHVRDELERQGPEVRQR